MTSRTKMLLASFVILPLLLPSVALAGQNDVVGVAIYFLEADGSTKPYLFHDLKDPLPRWSCEARLEYLTKMYYRMSRQNPDLKGKKAVRSACVKIEGFDFGSD